MEFKVCSKCKAEKPVAKFGKDIRQKSGLRPSCDACVAKQRKEHYAHDKTKILAACREYQKNNKDVTKNAKLLAAYGITLGDYNNLFQKQEGQCAICGRHQSELNRVLQVDHDHETGKVRELLCAKCNSLIGYAGEDTNTLLNAAVYVEKYKGNK